MKKIILNFTASNDTQLKEELKNHISRKYYRHLKSINAEFLVNKQIKKPHELINKGDIIEIIAFEEEKESNWPIINMELDIKYEDEHYLVVNKPSNLLTIPTKAEPISLYQLLVQYLNKKEIHILNRLDKETNGLVLVAKDRYSAYLLQPTHKHMERRYLCVVKGEVEKEGKIINYIAKNIDNNKRYVTDNPLEGKLAISNYKILKVSDGKSLLEFVLDTGRTHQIRVHCQSLGHPIIGDSIYGEDDGILLLRSYMVKFVNPYTQKEICIVLDKEGDFFE